MSYYRHMYTPDEVDEESYFQHRLALAGQGDMMEFARLHRMRDVDLTSSFMRYAQPRVGMYQDLNAVYREDCNVPTVTQQSSFNSEESLQNQSYRVYSYGLSGVSVPPQIYTSSAGEAQVNLHSIGSSQSTSTMGLGPDNPRVIHDLSTISRRSDLDWLTTTNTEIRTQSPHNTSSPRPPMYPSQPTPPNVAINPQRSGENPSSSAATSGHPHFRHHDLSGNLRSQSRGNKKGSSSNPSKPKGTPGRKRKFQDHELTPEEATKRRIRRERNKVAAAKCRNRRRELTDRLQGETDNLEDHQTQLQQEILSLQQEKEHLEFLLAAHTPNCKAMIRSVETVPLVPDEENRITVNPYSAPLSTVDEIMTGAIPENQFYYLQTSLSSHRLPEVTNSRQEVPKEDLKLENPIKIESLEKTENFSMTTVNAPTDLSNRNSAFPNASASTNIVPSINLENMTEESLNTPVCNLATPTYSTGIFTFPTTPNTCNTNTDISFSFPSSNATSLSKTNSTPSTTFTTPTLSRPSPIPQTCSLDHRRRSSSDSLTSPDSVKSHNLLAL